MKSNAPSTPQDTWKGLKFANPRFAAAIAVSIALVTSHANAGFIYADTVVATAGGELNTNFTAGTLITAGLTSSTDLLPITNNNNGKTYASDGTTTATLTADFTSTVDLNAFYLWNYDRLTSTASPSAGVKDFSLKFYDGAGGTGTLLATVGSLSATIAPGGGATTLAADTFNFSTVTGVRSVEFIIANNHGFSGFVGAQELAFNAVSTTVPTIVSLSPPNSASGVSPTVSLAATFSESVSLTDNGTVTIRNLTLGAGSDTVITLQDPQVTVSGSTVTINPTVDLDVNTNYAIRISADAVEDLTGDAFAGILNDTTWSFNTNTGGVKNYHNVILGDAPIVYYEFDETSGTTAVNSATTGSIYDGTFNTVGGSITVGQPSFAQGGTAYDFGGGFVGAASAVTSSLTAWTVEAWVNYDSAKNSASNYLGNDQGGWNNDVQFGIGPENGGVGVGAGQVGVIHQDNANSTRDWVGTSLAADEWHHVVMTGKNATGAGTSTLQLFVDGVLIDSDATVVGDVTFNGVGGVGTPHLTIGSNRPTPGVVGYWTFDGLLDEVAVYDQVLDAGTITNHYNAGIFSGPDETPPTVVALSPDDNATDVAPGSDLMVTFDDTIAIGTGNIIIKNLDAAAQTTIPVGDDRVSVSDATLTINPTANLAASTNYAIQIEGAAIDDDAGNSFAGISDDTTWNFTTGVPDLTAPTISTLSPVDGATEVALASNLVVTFDESISIGAGNITIKNLDTPAQTVITLPDPQVSVSGAVLTINPGSNFAVTTNYAIQIDVGVVEDLSGNPFAGILDNTTWNFVTANEPLRIMPLGDSITAGSTNGSESEPVWYGYRSGLYNRLNTAGYNFIFVGQSTERSIHTAGTVPPADLAALGQNSHNGYGGRTVSYLNSNIATWLANDDPNVILLKIGTNGQDQPGLNTLVNTITTTKPNLHLIIAEIMPKWNYQQGIVNYNTYIRDTLVPANQALGRNVTLVDQYAPFLTNPADLTSIDQSLFSNGINHPDNDGYDLMAQEWFEGIEALGLGPNNFTSWISDPAFGLAVADQDFDDDSDGDHLANVLEAWFGTHPGQFNADLAGFATDGLVTTFTHPQNANPPSDLSGFYQWSLNLSDWYAGDGLDGPGGGPTVNMSPSTVGTTTTVTATASEPLDHLFLRVGVIQN